MSLHAQSGICNLYQSGKRSLPMGAHVDNMERDFAFPVVSVSFGCAAVYLLGGVTKDEEPTPVLIRSGDVVVLSGDSRLAYHGVARVVPGSSPEGLFAEPEAAGEGAAAAEAVAAAGCGCETSGSADRAEALAGDAAEGPGAASAAGAGADCSGQHAPYNTSAPSFAPNASPACACERACLRAFLQQTRINVNVRQVQPVPAASAACGAEQL
jgi:hypothetical protein